MSFLCRIAGFLFASLLALPAAESAPDASVRAQMNRGKLLYLQHCVMCHQSAGQGTPGTFPPLANSDYLANTEATILALVQGLSGKVTVNGTNYDGVMPPVLLDDAKVIHETTPIQNDGPGGVRDTLVITFRERGFQAPGA